MSTAARRTLPAHEYYDDQTYALEQEQIWFRQWVYAGRSEQAGEAGAVLHGRRRR